LQKGGRNEDLGVMVERITATEGGQPRSYSLVESLSAPAYYPQPRWYYDPGTHHPSDLWLTYMAETSMGKKAMLALALPIVLIALLCVWFGRKSLGVV
jgi:hypothetical protein